MDFDSTTSLVGDLVNVEQLLLPSGVSRVAVERFFAGLGPALDAAPALPRAIAFVLVAHDAALGSAADYSAFLQEAERAQRSHKMLACNEGGTVTDHLSVHDVTQLVPALEWRDQQVSMVSAGGLKGRCVVLLNSYEAWVFVNGTMVMNYADIRYRTLQCAREFMAREAWNAELLARCAREHLSRRSRRGIWHLPDQFVLLNRPEELIEDMLRDFLAAHLRGFRSLIRQYHWEAKGRVDVYLELTNGLRLILELKWVGRALKQTQSRAKPTAKARKTKAAAKSTSAASASAEVPDYAEWSCEGVSIVPPSDALEGLPQLGDYMKRADTHHGILAVFDCRKPSMIAADAVPTGCEIQRCSVFVASVDPTSPSALAS